MLSSKRSFKTRHEKTSGGTPGKASLNNCLLKMRHTIKNYSISLCLCHTCQLYIKKSYISYMQLYRIYIGSNFDLQQITQDKHNTVIIKNWDWVKFRWFWNLLNFIEGWSQVCNELSCKQIPALLLLPISVSIQSYHLPLKKRRKKREFLWSNSGPSDRRILFLVCLFSDQWGIAWLSCRIKQTLCF